MSCRHLYWYVFSKILLRHLRIVSRLSWLDEAVLRCPKIILKRRLIVTWNLRIKVPPWNYNTNRNNVRKSLVVCATQLAGGLLLKKLKYFEFMLNIFVLSRVWENVESWMPSANKPFWIEKSYFLTDIIKQNQCQYLFLT